MLNIAQYNSSDDSNDSDLTAHLKPISNETSFSFLKTAIVAAPDVVPTVSYIFFKKLCTRKLFQI